MRNPGSPSMRRRKDGAEGVAESRLLSTFRSWMFCSPLVRIELIRTLTTLTNGGGGTVAFRSFS